MHTGSPELIEIDVDPEAADYVKEREWHRLQEIVEREDGSLLLRLCVCNDRPLRSWILSFGALARVVAPARIAQEIFEELQEARNRYTPRLMFEPLRMSIPDSKQTMLPLRTQRWKAS